MGRYYSGDIEGKFWFGIQPSDAASRFGGNQLEPHYITFEFQKEDLEKVELEIEAIKESLGDNKKILDDFFKGGTGYSNKDLDEMGITNNTLKDYADLGLGIKIRDCLKENGQCIFDAEL